VIVNRLIAIHVTIVKSKRHNIAKNVTLVRNIASVRIDHVRNVKGTSLRKMIVKGTAKGTVNGTSLRKTIVKGTAKGTVKRIVSLL
jgi:hypothetical protein